MFSVFPYASARGVWVSFSILGSLTKPSVSRTKMRVIANTCGPRLAELAREFYERYFHVFIIWDPRTAIEGFRSRQKLSGSCHIASLLIQKGIQNPETGTAQIDEYLHTSVRTMLKKFVQSISVVHDPTSKLCVMREDTWDLLPCLPNCQLR